MSGYTGVGPYSSAAQMRLALDRRLADLREQNDSDCSADETEQLRGRIKEVKLLQEALVTSENQPETGSRSDALAAVGVTGSG